MGHEDRAGVEDGKDREMKMIRWMGCVGFPRSGIDVWKERTMLIMCNCLPKVDPWDVHDRRKLRVKANSAASGTLPSKLIRNAIGPSQCCRGFTNGLYVVQFYCDVSWFYWSGLRVSFFSLSGTFLINSGLL